MRDTNGFHPVGVRPFAPYRAVDMLTKDPTSKDDKPAKIWKDWYGKAKRRRRRA